MGAELMTKLKLPEVVKTQTGHWVGGNYKKLVSEPFGFGFTTGQRQLLSAAPMFLQTANSGQSPRYRN